MDSKLIVVSNRMPVVVEETSEGWGIKAGAGGLVAALDPVLRKRGGVWVGWPGVDESARSAWLPLLEEVGDERGYAFDPVPLPPELVRDFYGGFSNAVLWPLLHNITSRCVFEPAYWEAYLAANERFAKTVLRHAQPGDLVWVHDYQLIGVAPYLRQEAPELDVAFFLHIPFPPLESFLEMPWRGEILSALLAYDLIGFQTERDRHNFLDCVRRLVPDAVIDESPERSADDEAVTVIAVGERRMRVACFPIGIDYPTVVRTASSRAVVERARELSEALGDVALILGVDRLDYTKGIPDRLLAYQAMLEEAPELHERVVLLQVVQPSREIVPEYQELKRQIDELVGAINGRFGTATWAPVHYLYRSVPWPELFALYRLARVALVTPLKDGMNLVAKEYVACQLDEPGALILSEFAGAAAQLHERALIVNPYDVEGAGRTLLEALGLSADERRRRMDALRHNVSREDVFWWTRRFLIAATQASPRLPSVQTYIPDFGHDAFRAAVADAEASDSDHPRNVEQARRPR
ncbi:MAG: trehalose-6-phosphate synthase [Polyangiaceae bacterium]